MEVKRMKKVFQAIGRFFKKNYWIEPLLLVAIVFIVVFSLEGVGGVFETIKSWFSPNSICKKCERVTVNKVFDGEEIKVNEGEKVYIYFYEKSTTENDMEDANKAMNDALKALKKSNQGVTVYGVNYAVKSYYEVNTDNVKKWYDRKMDQAKYDEIADLVKEWMESEELSFTDADLNSDIVPTPTLVCFTKVNGKVKVEYALRGTSEITNQTNLLKFLEGKFDDLRG